MGAPRWFRRVLLAIAIVASLPAGARDRPVRPDTTPPLDVFSAAEPAAIRTTHVALDLTVDFAAQKMSGTVTHTITNLSGTTRFALDTRYLVIRGVTIDGAPAAWTLEPAPHAGKTLAVTIAPSTREVTVDYETTVTNNGIVFMTAAQTAGDTDPFLYTFGEPDRTREWIPIQDTPGIRMTYEATIRVPPGLMALMSARNPTSASPDGVYRFEMPYPIPPYLIALAVGRLEFHPLDARTGFYAEPPFVGDAARELQYIPEMLRIAEDLLGPYPFERYDVLLAPPGYAAGGMENPMLNFLGVLGVISGDDEDPPPPNYVVAHEMAHSWAGDLATCATWNDTWLNEGFATYYGHRLMGEMLGPEHYEIGFYFERDSFLGYDASVVDRNQTILHRQFKKDDALSVFNATSYSKGGIFLQTLETGMGRANYDAMIRRWFGRHHFTWVDERAFIDELAMTPGVDEDALKIAEWIYGTGLPSNSTAPTHAAIWDRVAAQAARFRAGTTASSLDTAGWTNYELDLFLWQVTDRIAPRIAELDAKFGVSQLESPSVHWFLGVARTRYAPAMPMFERYLLLGGFNVIPIYQALAETASGKTWARQFYEKARPNYVPNIRANVDQILGVSGAKLRHAA